MVSHANLLANLAMIARAFDNTRRSTCVSWVPLYHDMGLIINALQSLYVGAACVLMTPVAFVQRPLVWLRAVRRLPRRSGRRTRFRLRSVRRALPSGADGRDQPVRLEGRLQWRRAGRGRDDPAFSQNLRARYGFAASAMLPAYGLAEATVAGIRRRARRRTVTRTVSRNGLRAGCRRAAARPRGHAGDSSGAAARIARRADRDCRSRQPERRSAPGRSAKSGLPGRMSRAAIGGTRRRAPLRSGARRSPARRADAGCAPAISAFSTRAASCTSPAASRTSSLSAAPITTRRTSRTPCSRAHPALRRHGGAAFAVPTANDAERLVVVQEVERTWRHRIDYRGDRRAHPRGDRRRARHRAARYRAAAAGRTAENHERQDPADAEPQTVAGGIA